jgi:glycosyltransferase involved in cell wall biosynthesis
MPDLSVIIPTYARPAKIAACVGALARQDLETTRFEVLVGLDGADTDAERAIAAAWPGASAGALRVVECPREGYNAVRNRLLREARGRYLVSLNDDVLPFSGFLKVHLEAQARAERYGRPAIITGHSAWVVHQPDRLFDRLMRETSMVFFQDAMTDEDPDRDWGFRHAWGLNVSFPTPMVRDVGGWTAFPLAYGYDDIEIAWRLRERFDTPVLYRPAAAAPHDHRMEPAGYLERERSLGRTAALFARANRSFAHEVFGRDITSDEEISYSVEYVERERVGVDRLRPLFLALADKPSGAIDDPDIIQMLYQQHVPLKRWEWRRGLLESCEASAPPGAASVSAR